MVKSKDFFILKIIFAPGSLLIYAREVMKWVMLENFKFTRGFQHMTVCMADADLSVEDLLLQTQAGDI